MIEEWLQKGYDPTTLLHRLLLLEKIKKYAPFEALLDIGCGHGPDLYLIQQEFKNIKIYGIDERKQLIEEVEEKIPIGFYFSGRYQDELSKFAENSIDIVITNGVLMYNNKEDLLSFFKIAKKAVILSEKTDTAMHNFLLQHNPIVTKISKDIRQTWGDCGYIFEYQK